MYTAILTKSQYMETIHTRAAGGIVVGTDGRIVIVNQNRDSWSLPKGHVETGEDDETTARREITEETGLTDLTLVRKLGEYSRFKIGKGGIGDDGSEFKTLVFFLFTTPQTALKPIDPQNPEAIWIDRADLAKHLTHPKDQEFFSGIIDTI